MLIWAAGFQPAQDQERAGSARSCVREAALSAEWESVRCEVTPHEAGGNCVVCEDWVGSNPRRRNSLQDDEPVSAGWTGEPATAWRSPGVLWEVCPSGCCDEKPGGSPHVVEGGMFRRQGGGSGEACAG